MQRQWSAVRLIVLVFWALAAAPAQGTDVAGRSSEKWQGAQFARGATTWAGSFLVGQAGGEFEVTPPNDTIDRITLSVPIGAVDSETRFAVGFNDGTLTTVKGTASGYVVEIRAGGARSFR